MVNHRVLGLLLLLLLVIGMHRGKTRLMELRLLLLLLLQREIVVDGTRLLLLLLADHVYTDEVRSSRLGWRARVRSSHGTRHCQRCRYAECLDSLLHRGCRRGSPRNALLVLLLLLLLQLLLLLLDCDQRWRLIRRKTFRSETP